jgi:hypothetical protein
VVSKLRPIIILNALSDIFPRVVKRPLFFKLVDFNEKQPNLETGSCTLSINKNVGVAFIT